MRNVLPLSLRLEKDAETTLGELAKKFRIPKATLASIILEAGIAAIKSSDPITMPLVFQVKGSKSKK